MKVYQAKRLKEIKNQNAQVKRPVAEMSLDKQMLQESPGYRMSTQHGF